MLLRLVVLRGDHTSFPFSPGSVLLLGNKEDILMSEVGRHHLCQTAMDVGVSVSVSDVESGGSVQIAEGGEELAEGEGHVRFPAGSLVEIVVGELASIAARVHQDCLRSSKVRDLSDA